MTKDDLKKFIADVVALRDAVSDKEASGAVGMYPGLHGDGRLIKAGTRLNIGGRLMRAAVDLYDNDTNTPDKAPTLWEDINYREGARIIPGSISAGLKFSKGEKGWWKGKVYESTIANNVWNPEQNSGGWEEI